MVVIFCAKVCLNQQIRNALKATYAVLIVHIQLKELQMDAPSWRKNIQKAMLSTISSKPLSILKQTKSSHANQKLE